MVKAPRVRRLRRPPRQLPICCPNPLPELPRTGGRILEGPSKVPGGLSVVVSVLPTCSLTSCNRESSESDVVHDHIRLRQHQIVAVTCIVVRIVARPIELAGTPEVGETVGSSSGSEFSSGGARPR
jgi:hypothetical protein